MAKDNKHLKNICKYSWPFFSYTHYSRWYYTHIQIGSTKWTCGFKSIVHEIVRKKWWMDGMAKKRVRFDQNTAHAYVKSSNNKRSKNRATIYKCQR